MMPKRLQKPCKGCGKVLPREAFYQRKSGGTDNHCPPCAVKRTQAWRATAVGRAKALAANLSEAGKARQVRYFATPKGKQAIMRRHAARRARKAGAICSLTRQEWVAIKEMAGHRCHYCKKQMARLAMDHVVPLSKGGHHVASNIVPACKSCNSKKGTRLLTLL
jgi:5-methylcytosine-specific restriction endonuclease McrA